MSASNTLPVACNRDCGAACSLVAERGPAGTVRIRNNPRNHSLKIPCARGIHAAESRNAPDRLTRPLVRSGRRGSGSFAETDWDNALSIVARRLGAIIDTDGPEAIVSFAGSGACRGVLHNTNLLTARFLNLLGPVTWLKGSYSFQAAAFVTPFAFGRQPAGFDVRTLLETRFVILWGANISDTRFGNETEQVMRHIRQHGGEVIVIDPRRTRTAKTLGTEWIPIRPGTDSAAMLAIAWVLFSEGLVDSDFVATHVHGADEVRNHVLGAADGVPKTPEWAESICGIPASRLLELARRYGRARPAALIPGYSIQRAYGGEEASRMAIALQALTGNAGRAGGTPGVNLWFPPASPPGPRVAAFESSQPTGDSIPKATWPEAILARSDSSQRLRAAYVCGSNYLNQGSDATRSIAAFDTLDFVVCNELFLTPTARHADVVLPATHFLEREDVVTAEDNYLYYSAQVFEPAGEARDDFDIFADLSRRLGLGDAFDEGLDKASWLERIIAESAVGAAGKDAFRDSGIFDGGDHQRYGLAPFISDPEAHPLDTPSGRIEISSESYAETGFPAWPAFRPAPPSDGYPLMLVSPHSRFRINSTGDNIAWVRERDPVRLWMHPADAEARTIADGAEVDVRSETGTMRVTVSVTEEIMPGVVSCIQGAWMAEDPSKGGRADGSVNRVTPLEPTRPSIGTRTHSVMVEISPSPLPGMPLPDGA